MSSNMPADITGSNFPPTAKEESVLRVLLKQKEDELKVATEHILKARTSVASSTDAIRKLTNSREFACVTVNTYKTHIKNLRASLGLLETRFTFAPRDTTSPDPTPCVALSDLLTPDILKRRANAKLEIKEMEEISVKVNATILDIDEELRCLRYVDQVNSESLESCLAIQKTTQSAVDKISSAFRAIKRVPNEIWSDILSIRIAQDSSFISEPTGLRLFLPALPISQVCRTWRSVVRSSPSMWRAISWRMSPDDEPNYNCLDIWGEMSGQERLTVYETQSREGTSAVQILGRRLPDRSQNIFYQVFQSRHRNTSGIIFNADNSPKISIFGLHLCAPTGSRNLRVQPELYSQFSSVKLLYLSNLLPRPGLTLQGSLTHLKISFFQAHKSYELAGLLIPSLNYLCLQHFEMTGTPVLRGVVQLPNLLILDMTPVEHTLVEKLEMPRLSVLTLSSPVKVSASPDGWLDSIIALCATVTDLGIDCSSMGKRKERGDTMDFHTIHILAKLLPQMHNLREVKVVGGIFEGGGLADIVEKKKNEGVDFRKLSELTIENCIGVSQIDCERLVQLVEKLNVYRTFHKDGKL